MEEVKRKQGRPRKDIMKPVEVDTSKPMTFATYNAPPPIENGFSMSMQAKPNDRLAQFGGKMPPFSKA